MLGDNIGAPGGVGRRVATDYVLVSCNLDFKWTSYIQLMFIQNSIWAGPSVP
jgi:hypothetical protein